MLSWTKYLRRPQKIEKLYKKPPSLSDFELAELVWEGDENACILRGALSRFPDFPRTSWEDDANRFGIRLKLEGIDEFSMEGWSFENIVDMELERTRGGMLRLEATGERLDFSARFQLLQVDDLFAFRTAEGQ